MNANEVLLEKLYKLPTLLKNYREKKGGASSSEAGAAAFLPHEQRRILALLSLKNGVSVDDMAEILGIKGSALNDALLGLKGKNYLMCEQTSDKRIVIVRLTQKGANSLVAMQPQSLPEPLDCLSDDEKNQFNRYLDRIILASDTQKNRKPVSDTSDFKRQHDELFRRFLGKKDRKSPDTAAVFEARKYRQSERQPSSRGPLVDYGDEACR